MCLPCSTKTPYLCFRGTFLFFFCRKSASVFFLRSQNLQRVPCRGNAGAEIPALFLQVYAFRKPPETAGDGPARKTYRPLETAAARSPVPAYCGGFSGKAVRRVGACTPERRRNNGITSGIRRKRGHPDRLPCSALRGKNAAGKGSCGRPAPSGCGSIFRAVILAGKSGSVQNRFRTFPNGNRKTE